MKQTFIGLLVFALITALVGCGRADGPSQVAEAYCDALAERDFARAAELVHPEHRQAIEWLAATPTDFSEIKGAYAISEEIYEEDGLTFAEVIVRFPKNGEEEEIDLQLVDGRWFIDLSDAK